MMTLPDALKTELAMALPGSEAQMIMAPVGRKLLTDQNPGRNAAVSVVIVPNKEETNGEIILIKRSEYEGHHSDQVSFPGGKQEAVDLDLFRTAIRECYEEIGLILKPENLLGALTPLYIPVSEYMVFPFIFIYDNPLDFHLNTHEVKYVIRFPLQELFDKNLIQNTILKIREEEIQVPYFAIQKELVWGATAMILSELIVIFKNIKMKHPGIFS